MFERDDGSVALWLEDVGDPEPWPDADIADVARRLAAMPSLVEGPRWFARDWLPRYLDLRAYRFDPELPFWRRRDEIVARVEAGPRVLVHNDFHPGNIFRPGGDPVVIPNAEGSHTTPSEPELVPEAEFTYFVGNALRYGWAPTINEHFASVYAALASAATTRLPSFT